MTETGERMITLAIPLFGERVSPHFSTAPQLMVVVLQRRQPSSTIILPLVQDSIAERRNKLLSLGVTTLICNGIDQATLRWLERRGVRVLVNIVGAAEDVLNRLMPFS